MCIYINSKHVCIQRYLYNTNYIYLFTIIMYIIIITFFSPRLRTKRPPFHMRDRMINNNDINH